MQDTVQNIGQLLQSPDPLALYQALQNRDNLSRKTKNYQNLAKSNLGAAGWAGVAGNLIGGILGRKNQKKLDASNQQYSQQKAVYNQELTDFKTQREEAKTRKANQQRYQALVAKFGEQGAKAIVYGGVKPSDLKQGLGTTLMQNAKAAGIDLNTPEGQAYIKHQMNKPSGQTINIGGKQSPYQVGKIPDGKALIKNTQGLPEYVDITGSPQLAEAKKDGLQSMRKTNNLFADHENINSVIDKSIDQADTLSTGFLGSWIKGIPGTQAADLQANLKTIQADAAFSRLQQMRDESPTGGALGQVSERELSLLSSARASLEQSQSPEQFKENLARYKKVRQGVMLRVAQAYKADYGDYPQGYEQPQTNQQPMQTIVNQQTGERMGLVNGKWVRQ